MGAVAGVSVFPMKDLSAARRFVRFYVDYIDCDFCGQPTRGRVYDRTQEVTCGSCGQILLIVESVYEI